MKLVFQRQYDYHLAFVPEAELMYAIKNDRGTFELYVNGQFMGKYDNITLAKKKAQQVEDKRK